MKLLTMCILFTSFLTSSLFAQEASVSKVRVFEVKDVAYGYGDFNDPNCDNEEHCRFIEVELKNNSYLTVKNCTANETAFIHRVTEPKIDKMGSNSLKKSCEEIISKHKLSPELLARLQKQLGHKSRSAFQIAKHSGKFAVFAVPTLAMGFLTVISAPTPASLLFGSVTTAGGAFSYVTAADAKKEIMGQATLVERYGQEVKPKDVIKRNQTSVIFVLPTNWLARANNRAIRVENERLYSDTFDNYVEGWKDFADYLARK